MRELRDWSWNLPCPKCGYDRGLLPEWSGESVWSTDEPRRFIETGFAARCPSCDYREEVVPLDRQAKLDHE